MKHLVVVLLLAIPIIGAPVASVTAADLSRTENLGKGFADALNRAVKAADGYASALFSRDSAEYTAHLRQALNRSFRTAIETSPNAERELTQHTATLQTPALKAGPTSIIGGIPVSPNPSTPIFDANMSLLDRDPRYRANVSALTVGSQGIDERNRIWGGLPTAGYLNTVVIVGGTQLCSGTVIARNPVLTAQHCHCGGVAERVYVGSVYNDQQQSYPVARSVPMKPCSTAVSVQADVALMFTDTDFDPRITPAPLADSGMINQARIVRVVGFGRTEYNQIGQKMMVDIPVASPSCTGHVPTRDGEADDSSYYGCNAKFEMVAGAPLLNKDTCNGDSGGPLFIRNSAGQDYLAGATSRAIIYSVINNTV